MSTNGKSSDSLISLQNVRKIYKTKAGPLEVLKGVNLEIGRGEFVAFVHFAHRSCHTLLAVAGTTERPTGTPRAAHPGGGHTGGGVRMIACD